VFFIQVKEKLAHDPDSEVATTSLRVSLLCPVSKISVKDVIFSFLSQLLVVETKSVVCSFYNNPLFYAFVSAPSCTYFGCHSELKNIWGLNLATSAEQKANCASTTEGFL